MDWEEQQGDLAQRANLTVRNVAINNTWIHALAKLNCVIRIRSSWNGGGNVSVFDGNIWDWRYVSETQKELSLMAYDPLIRLQQSQDFKYYSAGLRTQDLLGDICADWGIPSSIGFCRKAASCIAHATSQPFRVFFRRLLRYFVCPYIAPSKFESIGISMWLRQYFVQ